MTTVSGAARGDPSGIGGSPASMATIAGVVQASAAAAFFFVFVFLPAGSLARLRRPRSGQPGGNVSREGSQAGVRP